MKRFLLSIFLLHACSLTAIDEKPSLINALYYGYYFVKEFAVTALYDSFFFNHEKLKQISVACKSCHAKMHFAETLGWAISQFRSELVDELKKQAYYGSVEDLNQFVWQIHQDYHMQCPACMDCYEWVILDDAAVSHDRK